MTDVSIAITSACEVPWLPILSTTGNAVWVRVLQMCHTVLG